MDRIAKLKSSEREELFITTSHDMKLPEAMTEKDFLGMLDAVLFVQ